VTFPCLICGQDTEVNMLNHNQECHLCAITLELPGGTPRVSGGKICRVCRTLLKEYVLFNVKQYGCPKCGRKE